MTLGRVQIMVLMLSMFVVPAFGQDTAENATASGQNVVRRKLVPPGTTPKGRSDARATNESALEFAPRLIELETQRLDKLVSNTEMVGKLMATLIFAFAAMLSFFGYRNIKEIKAEMQAAVENVVDKTLKTRSKSSETFEHLAKSLESAQMRWAKIKESIDNLAKFEAVSGSQHEDAQGAYGMVKKMSGKQDITPDDRRAALGYLLKIIELGEQGRVDPNLLFNACSVALEMNFDHEALKLASLCAHWDPKPSHILRKSRLEDTFGMRFELKDNKLVRSEQTPAKVRAEAWKNAKEQVLKRPTFQCELIFSELHNIATRNREWGYIDEAIAVMEEITNNGTAPSYAFAVLSGFYAMRGDSTWLNDYLTTATMCCLSRNWTFPAPGLACPGKGNGHEERTQEVYG